MAVVPAAPPQPLAVQGPFASLVVDSERRRMFAAGANAVAIVDAATGKQLALIRIGGVRCLALEPLGGHVFAATADGRISELDPERRSIVRSLDAGAPAAALLEDSAAGRLYVALPGALAVFDSVTFARLAPVALADGTPDALARDPVTGELYVSFAGRPRIAVVDPRRGAVRTAFATPGTGNASVAFDGVLGEVIAIGNDGAISAFDRAGTPLGTLPGDPDAPPAAACDLDPLAHALVCGDSGGLTFTRLDRAAAPSAAGRVALAGGARGAFDARTHGAIAVSRGAAGAAAVQVFRPLE